MALPKIACKPDEATGEFLGRRFTGLSTDSTHTHRPPRSNRNPPHQGYRASNGQAQRCGNARPRGGSHTDADHPDTRPTPVRALRGCWGRGAGRVRRHRPVGQTSSPASWPRESSRQGGQVTARTARGPRAAGRCPFRGDSGHS